MPGLLRRDQRQRVAEQFAVIERDRGDGAGGRPIDHVGRVAAAAETHLQHAQIGRRPREQMERDRGDHLEHRDRGAGVDLLDMLECRGQRRVRHQFAGDPDAFVEPHQMRRRIDMHALPRRLRHRPQEGAGAALAVGAGDMHHRRQAALGMIELRQQLVQPIQAEIDQPRMQAVQPRDDAFDPTRHG